MIKIVHESYNFEDLVELYYDTELKNYIFIVNNHKIILKNSEKGVKIWKKGQKK